MRDATIEELVYIKNHIDVTTERQAATERLIRELEMKQQRDRNGYPILPDGSIDWAKTSEEKQAVADKYEKAHRIELGMRAKPHRKHGSNYTPPKRRHRK